MSIEQAGSTAEPYQDFSTNKDAEKSPDDIVVKVTAVMAGVALVAAGALATIKPCADWARSVAGREVTVCDGDTLYSNMDPLTPKDGILVSTIEQPCVTIQVSPLATTEQERTINGEKQMVQVVRLDHLEENTAISEATVRDISRFKGKTDSRTVWIIKGNSKDTK